MPVNLALINTKSVFKAAVKDTVTSIKTKPGAIFNISIINYDASVRFLQVFDVASTSVTLGTTTPVYVLGVASSGVATAEIDSGIYCGTAISIAVTTTSTGSTGATTGADVSIVYSND